MKTKEITICGKQVTLAFCYAAEIAYKDITGEDMIDFIRHAIECINQQRDPDAKKTISAILSCATAYDQSQEEPGKEVPSQLTAKELMNNAKPAEFGMALLAVLDLRAQFYHVAKTDEEEVQSDEKEDDGKNA